MAVYIEKYNDLIHEMSEVVWVLAFRTFCSPAGIENCSMRA